MSKALTNYLNNIKGEDIKISAKTIVTTIENEPKTIQVINIVKKEEKPQRTNDFQVSPKQDIEYKVTVKLYMTKQDSVNFTFHSTWNEGKAMPLRVMYGKLVGQTKNMVKMQLKGKITETGVCLKCGRALTNEISKLYGLGPECGQHYYINPLSKEEFELHKQSIQNKLEEITWEGWIPKVAIISMEEVSGTT